MARWRFRRRGTHRSRLVAATMLALAPAVVWAEVPEDCLQDADNTLKITACTSTAFRADAAEDRAEALFQRSRAYVAADRPLDALDDLRDAIGFRGDVARYWVSAAYVLGGLGDSRAAEAYLKRADQLEPGLVDVPLTRAKIQMMDKDFTGADRSADEALALDPGNLDAMRIKGFAAQSRGDFEASLEQFIEVKRRDPDSALASLDLGGAYYMLDDLDQAEKYLLEAISRDAKLASAHNLLGQVRLHQDRPAEALDAIQTAIALNPSSPAYHVALGRAWTALEEPDKARAVFDEAIRIDPGIADATVERAMRSFRNGHEDRALEAFAIALLIAPRNAYILKQRAEMYAEEGKFDAAIADLTRVIEFEREKQTVGHSAWVYEWRAKMYLRADEAEAAAADYRTALGLYAKSLKPMYAVEYGTALRENGAKAAALEFFEAALSVNPNNAEALVQRGLLLDEAGRWDEAIRDYRRATEILPAAISDKLRSRADALLDAGQAERALVLITLVAEASPEDSETQEDLADFYRKTQDYPRALEIYDRALALDPENRTAWRYRGDTLRLMSDLEAAVADYTTAIQVDPEYKQAFVRRGNALQELGDCQAALADFDRAIEIDAEYDLAYRERADCKSALGAYDAAIADYTRALEIDPEYLGALDGRRNAFYATRQYEAALQDAQRHDQISPDDARNIFSRGRIHRMMGNVKLAVSDLSSASEAGQPYAALYLYLTEYPENPAAADNLRRHAALLQSGEWPQPIMTYLLGELDIDQLAALARNDGELCEAKFYAASNLLLGSEIDKAIPLLREAARLCPVDFMEYDDARAELLRLGVELPQ